MQVLAIDVGGTKVAAALIDRAGHILCKLQQPTEISSLDASLHQILALSTQLLDGKRVSAVSLSVPMVLDRATETVLWAPNLPGWENTDVKGILSERLGIPAFIEYDGHAAALGEWWGGAGRGCESLASIIIGTGIGAGFVAEGSLWRGYSRLAGAVGWFPLHTEEGTTTWESVASGTGIVRRARRRIEQNESTTLTDDNLTAKAVFAASKSGDILAQQVVEETAHYIGLGVAAVISFANPQVVILGGSIGQNADLMLTTIRRTASEWAQPYSARDTTIVLSTLGEEAGLLGAAYSAFSQLEPKE